MQIGKYLKKIRTEKGASIREIANKIDLSPAALSNIERDVNSPTLSTLSKICEALGIHIVDLLQQCDNHESEKIIFRKTERKPIDIAGENGAHYELVSVPNHKFQILSVTLDVKCDYGYVSKKFPHDEIAMVLRGTLQLQIGEDTFLLEEGDTIYLKAGLEYKYRNPTDSPCETIWAIQGINQLEGSEDEIY